MKELEIWVRLWENLSVHIPRILLTYLCAYTYITCAIPHALSDVPQQAACSPASPVQTPQCPCSSRFHSLLLTRLGLTPAAPCPAVPSLPVILRPRELWPLLLPDEDLLVNVGMPARCIALLVVWRVCYTEQFSSRWCDESGVFSSHVPVQWKWAVPARWVVSWIPLCRAVSQ